MLLIMKIKSKFVTRAETWVSMPLKGQKYTGPLTKEVRNALWKKKYTGPIINKGE